MRPNENRNRNLNRNRNGIGFGFGFGIGLGLLLFVGGCGFVPGAPFTGRAPAGDSAFGDDRPVEVCEGGARLGKRDATPIGWCGLDVTSAAPCEGDGDCRSRERCVCGACVVAPCDSNDECGEGRICDFNDRRCDHPCTIDGDCQKGERCLPGRNVCRGACTANADCQTGERCDTDKGRCTTESCAASDECGGLACGLLRTPAELAEPSILAVGDALELWFERRTASGPTLWRAVSRGAATDRFAIVGGAIADGAAPSVVRSGNGYDVVFTSGDELLAATSDGATLSAVESLATGLRAPTHVIASDGTRQVLAARADGSAIVDLTGGVIVDAAAFVSPPYVLAASRVGSPYREAAPDAERLWCTLAAVESGPSRMFDSSVPTPENDSIALALADGKGGAFSPYPYNPVLARVETLTNHPQERAPALLVQKSVRYLYYERASANDAAPENLRVTRSPSQ